jgi:hypothetical protein
VERRRAHVTLVIQAQGVSAALTDHPRVGLMGAYGSQGTCWPAAIPILVPTKLAGAECGGTEFVNVGQTSEMIAYLLILTRKDDQGRPSVELNWAGTYGLGRPVVSDPDDSYVVKIGELEVLNVVEKAIQDHFWEYDASRRDNPAWFKWCYERMNKKGSEAHLRRFLPQDGAGQLIARRMLHFIYDNRLQLGDEGDWLVWTCRDLACGRAGANLADWNRDEKIEMVGAQARHDMDYRDELDSYRFPSISCLEGASQALSRLRGREAFLSLFVRDDAGVYIVFDESAVLYIGMSQCFSQRLQNTAAHHKLGPISKKHPEARLALIYYPYWKLAEIDNVVTEEDERVLWGHIRHLLFDLEQACIGHYQPRYNGRPLDAG